MCLSLERPTPLPSPRPEAIFMWETIQMNMVPMVSQTESIHQGWCQTVRDYHCVMLTTARGQWHIFSMDSPMGCSSFWKENSFTRCFHWLYSHYVISWTFLVSFYSCIKDYRSLNYCNMLCLRVQRFMPRLKRKKEKKGSQCSQFIY